MFFRMCAYRIKKMVRTKGILFWSLAFPIILGTMFYLAFGSVFEENERFHAIPIAVVEVEGASSQEAFLEVLNEVSKEGKDQLFQIEKLDEDEAKERLRKEEIKGYVLVGDEISMVVKGSGIHESIIKSFLDQYGRMENVVTLVAREHPENLPAVLEDIRGEEAYTNEISFGKGNMDTMAAYFYALLAMVCIYGSLWGMDNVTDFMANMSALGARRSVSPASKLIMIAADGFAAFLVHSVEILLVFAYLKWILGVDFGNQTGFVVLACLVGSVIGIAWGSFLGVVIKGNQKTKESAVLGIDMAFCFLSGLMIVDIKNILENNAPLLNRINPCTLLVDALYSLNIYEGMGRYIGNLSIMMGMAVALCLVSALLLRRERYASL